MHSIEDELFFEKENELVGQFLKRNTAVVDHELVIDGLRKCCEDAVKELIASIKDLQVNIGNRDIYNVNKRASNCNNL